MLFSAGLGVLSTALQAVKRYAGPTADPHFFLLDKNVWFLYILLAL